MEQIESVRTIECLRGRLLAERAATKSAKHEAALMENKLIELESKLSEETKFKNKAEKKLAFLLNKLQSLKINYVYKDSENSVCHVSTSAEDEKEHCTKEPIPADCRSENCIGVEINTETHRGSSNYSEDASSTVTTKSETNAENGSGKYFSDLNSNKSFDGADDINQRQRIDEFKDSTVEQILKSEQADSITEERVAANSLALVPASPSLQISSSERVDGNLKIGDHSGTVTEALYALRRARKEIERSMERRRMIKVWRAQLISS
uniref:Uncharacterized protein n=1 Tax=Kalanchoe fedtschenkoi TaxID=63787 RepID=A0A7N0TYI4_KALFE